MDSYYKELIKKERAAFERVLASKVNIAQRDTERKLQKQINEANARYKKALQLEKRFKDNKSHTKRLVKEVDTMKKNKKYVLQNCSIHALPITGEIAYTYL